MKARIINTPIEVEVQPYFPEGMFAGFTDVTGQLQPGMVVYRASDLEFESYQPLPKSVDWDAFRREAAKDILCAIVQHDHLGKEAEGWKFKENAVGIAIIFADELIRQLKEQ